MGLPKLYTKAEVCEYLSIAPATLDRLVSTKQLSALKIGGSVRFEEPELERYLDSCRTGKSAQMYIMTQAKRRGRPPKEEPRQYYPGMKVV